MDSNLELTYEKYFSIGSENVKNLVCWHCGPTANTLSLFSPSTLFQILLFDNFAAVDSENFSDFRTLLSGLWADKGTVYIYKGSNALASFM